MKIQSAKIVQNETDFIIEVTYTDGSSKEVITVSKQLVGAEYYVNEFCNLLCLVEKMFR